MDPSTSMMRWVAASLALTLIACGGDDLPSEPPAQPQPAAIAVVSGQDQSGKAGETLPEPFVVRVTDAGGEGVAGVEVTWRVTAGSGEFVGALGGRFSSLSTITDPDGVAGATFWPLTVGTSAARAEADGLDATFTADATVLVIRLIHPLGGCAQPAALAGPDGSSGATVPVGTPVEWVPSCDLHVTSTLEPAGAESFDSGIVSGEERFRFVPGVTGTWEYREQITGETGTLTAQ